jgi:hypothetical protein
MAVDSNRIVNMMRADQFFYQQRGKLHLRKIEAERFNLTPAQARKMLKKPVEKKIAKPSTNDLHFEKWQLDLAERVLSKEN